ncbi:zinc finger, CCHC-type containing protein [Tanacetum coccineum]
MQNLLFNTLELLSIEHISFSSFPLFANPSFSLTTKEHEITRTLGDIPDLAEGYRKHHLSSPDGNNMVTYDTNKSDWVQNGGCHFHGLRSEDPNQHLKDFLKIVDSLDLNVENRERTRLRLFQVSLRDQASNWLERLPTGSISTWEDLTTRFLAQLFPSGRTAKL